MAKKVITEVSEFVFTLPFPESDLDNLTNQPQVGMTSEPAAMQAPSIVIQAPQRDEDALAKLLFKVRSCPNYHTLFALENDFNAAGLTLQMTGQNWMTLCRLIDGKFKASKVIDDFIFVAPLDKKGDEIPERSLEIIMGFIQTKAGPASKIAGQERSWMNGVEVYDRAIAIVHEDVKRVAQAIID